MKENEAKQYDVVIVGTGMGGSILGSILAKNNLSVVMIDRSTHPRFAIGESTIPATTAMLEFLALRYGVPEFNNLSSIQQVTQKIKPTCGIKRNFGFVYHRENLPQDHEETNQTLVFNEIHYFRQDIDAYLLEVAIRYGCHVHQNTQITDVQIDSDEVMVFTSKGQVRSKYIVDGSGYQSILASKFDLRENPTRGKTHSRGIFTHMLDVKPFDECSSKSNKYKTVAPWHQGTLHHIFDGGWMWVIPFNNHDESKNELTSVGLMLDPRKFPRTGLSAEDEFSNFLEKYPDVAPQFENAKSVREWVSTDRIQYSSKKCVGDRFCLLSHATGFTDPLFSRGLFNTVETINVLANLLIKSQKSEDFSESSFKPVEVVQQGLTDFGDRLVNCSYISFRSYQLWNAWFRIWLLTGIYARYRIHNAFFKYQESSDDKLLESLDKSLPGAITNQEDIMNLFSCAADCLEKLEQGLLSELDAEKKIYSLLRENEVLLIPLFDFLSPESRYSKQIPPKIGVKIMNDWAGKLPQKVKNEHFDFPLEALFGLPKPRLRTNFRSSYK